MEEPPETGILMTKEAFYTRKEIEQIAGNINDGARVINTAWMSAGEEYFADNTRKPLDGSIPED